MEQEKSQNEQKQKNVRKQENWIDDVMERQKHDLELEEEILSNVPKRLQHKYLNPDEE